MIKIYCYDRCTTCKKALAWCDSNGVKYEKIDIKGDHPDEATLRELHKLPQIFCGPPPVPLTSLFSDPYPRILRPGTDHARGRHP